MSLDIFRSTLLGDVPHGFFGRNGGVSTGAAASLNCGLGSGDDPEAVAENRRRAADAIAPGAALVGVYQVHSPRCVTVAEPWGHEARPEADALVTNRPGILLSIVTADCAPVLLADRQAGVIGAAHAGWRGALEGVTDNVVAAMETLGARRANIVASVGPCIAQPSYEVDQAFRDRFVGDDPATADFFVAGPAGKPHFSLAAYVLERLERASIGGMSATPVDTYGDEAHFYSFRRATHRGEPTYGRQISIIGLPAG